MITGGVDPEKRERIAAFLAVPGNEGTSNKATARALGISEQTIRRYKASTTGAVDVAKKKGKPPADEPRYTTMRLDQLTIDKAAHTRVSLDQSRIDDYAEAMEEGIIFPAVVVFHDGKVYRVGDFHRVAAAIKAGLESIPVEIRKGGLRDATIYNAGSDKAHGLNKSNADKRKAVEYLLADDEWSSCSGRTIARHVGCSAPFVEKVAKDGGFVRPAERTYTDSHGNQGTIRTDGIKQAAADRKVASAKIRGQDAPAKGQSMVDGVLTDDPPKVAAMRESGKIAPGAVPEITTGEVATDEPDDSMEANLEPPPLEAWLDSLPLSSKLEDNSRRHFRTDAALYHHVSEARKTFAHHVSRAMTTASRESEKGAYAYRLRACLKVDGPDHWKVCPSPENGGCGGTGTIPLTGDCGKCHGRGYLIL